jgi:hypothetical protein
MKNQTQTQKQKLTLKRETLRELTKPELRLVAGGALGYATSAVCT